jgi:hypothetical protein
MQKIDTLSLIGGIWACLPMIYFFLGLFSNARWLQPNWERQSGQWVVHPTPRLVRVLYVLAFGLLAIKPFAEAFHCDSGWVDLVAAIMLAVVIGFLIFVSKREKAQKP